MTLVKWITATGKIDKEQKRVTPILEKLYVGLLKEFRISRFIPLCLVDRKSWNYKQGLNMNKTAVAHYSEGISVGHGPAHEAILLLENVLEWDDAQTAVPKILRHELVHAKLKGKEKQNCDHGALFKKTANKYGNCAKKGDY